METNDGVEFNDRPLQIELRPSELLSENSVPENVRAVCLWPTKKSPLSRLADVESDDSELRSVLLVMFDHTDIFELIRAAGSDI